MITTKCALGLLSFATWVHSELRFLWIFIFLDHLLIYETPVWSSNSQSLASEHFPAPVIASWICWPLRLQWFTQGFCCRLKTFELYQLSTFLSASLMMILFHISSVECSRIEKNSSASFFTLATYNFRLILLLKPLHWKLTAHTVCDKDMLPHPVWLLRRHALTFEDSFIVPPDGSTSAQVDSGDRVFNCRSSFVLQDFHFRKSCHALLMTGGCACSIVM